MILNDSQIPPISQVHLGLHWPEQYKKIGVNRLIFFTNSFFLKKKISIKNKVFMAYMFYVHKYVASKKFHKEIIVYFLR